MNLSAQLVRNPQIEKMSENRKIVEFILCQIEHVDIPKMKLHPEFLKFICSIIENQVSSKAKKEGKIDKMAIFCDVMKELHVSDQELEDAKVIVEFLLLNKLIKKTSWKKIIWYFAKKYLFHMSEN